MSAFDVITIGSATQDVFLRSSSFEEIRNPLAPDGFDARIHLGSKIDLDDVVFTHGGGAMNAAVTLSRFGLKTACVARLGKDHTGEMIMQALEQANISAKGLQFDAKKKSAYSLVLVSGSGHRAILTHRGASAAIEAKEIAWKKLSAPWIYLTSVGGNKKLLKDVFAHAKKTRTRIAWNPGAHELELGYDVLEPYLLQTSILSLNREEAAQLTGLPPRQTEKILTALFHLTPAIILLTDGDKGAYMVAHGKALFTPAISTKVINTTGAGDAFGSAFLASYLREKNQFSDRAIEKALKTAMLNATSVVSHMGAQIGILPKPPGLLALRRAKIKPVKL